MTAANGIVIIPEVRDDAPQFAAVRSLFDWAERICFLGFGFDSLNVTRLGLRDVVLWRRDNKKPGPQVYATVLEKTNAEVNSFREQLGGLNVAWEPHNQKNLMMLRNTPILLP
jgi:hypothetical protein